MSKRFTYRRMLAHEFRDDLAAIDMPPLAFGRIFGFDEDRIRGWLSGAQDIPIWVPVVTAILKNTTGSLPAARQQAAERIISDALRPQLGEYPYLQEISDAD